jgi:hypothetical protein
VQATTLEREFFLQAKDQDIITYFKGIKDRRVNLYAEIYKLSYHFAVSSSIYFTCCNLDMLIIY